VPVYFFDTHDNERFIEGDHGVELPDLKAAALLAAESLIELARDVVPGSIGRELAVEVRDDRGPILRTILHFEAVILRPALTSCSEELL
jgi:hypothetical protein